MNITFKVDGMTCTGCAKKVETILLTNDCAQVSVSNVMGEASFTIKDVKKVKNIAKQLSNIGYNSQIKDNNNTSSIKKWNSLNLQLIICALFTTPLLFHMLVKEESFLNNPLLQLCLCLPVYIIGTMRFGKSAWYSIKEKYANMDVLIFTGTSAAFIYSIIGSFFLDPLNPHHYLFFETSSSIITLVLLGNFIEKRAVKKTTSSLVDLKKLQVKKATLIHLSNKTSIIPSNEIAKGNKLLINLGEKVPTDGTIFDGEGLIDESLISGESTPVIKKENDVVIAGSILIDGSIKIVATKNIQENTISEIEKLVVGAQQNQPSIQKIGDKVSSIFVPAVLIISLFTFFASWQFASLGIQQSILSSIAVLVISCPCAMGLATPTAVMVGIGKSSKDGALIKSGETLEKIAQANTYVFDKTGTLTTGNFILKKINCFKAIDEKEIRSIVRSLEAHSNHPIAISLSKELKESNHRELTEIKETKGISIEGLDNNKNNWKVGSFKILKERHDTQANLFVLKNNSLVAEIFIEDELKKDANELINFLKKNKKRIVLMSGDQKKRCAQIANQLNIKEFYYELLPEEKLTHIKKLTKDNVVVMIGDGINDAPALSLAHVGISFGNATEIAKNSSEVVIIGENNLLKVIKTIENSHLTLKTIKQNLFWALGYNVIAIPIAAIGLLSPIIAAGSMAFSDLVVIGNSIRLKFK